MISMEPSSKPLTALPDRMRTGSVVTKQDAIRIAESRRHRLIGNGPLLVRRDDGSVVEFSSALDNDEALAAYEADPGKFAPVEGRS